MDFLKNKRYLVLGVLFLALAVAAPFLKQDDKPKCEEPQKLLVEVLQYDCSQSLDPMALNMILCDQLKGEPFGCELGDADRPAGEKIIKDMINKCVDDVFKQYNMCVDKYQRL